ncbi:LOW QUALITY PROTEIN: ovochymase-2-like [Bufo gargarizans]|uniref:LOW QUALITY PROTEIN: ovochymase-2-like n=1 Tax=Bufo gargarizans TaxID=30331 RepID=UPI001CF5B90A|nr:LOW QUALITY PROTEIN: ovochymase-2-like [Bufo gargarizans]
MAETSIFPIMMLTVMIGVGRGVTDSSGRVSRCGERPAANASVSYGLLSRIVGGTSAVKGESPWMVSLKRDGKHFCGGTIISDKYVLTAAHCVLEKNFEYQVSVSIGDHDFTVYERSEQRFAIKAVFKHPNFNPIRPFNYDLAILELVESITFDKDIQPACLPSPDDVFPTGTLCMALGWGRLQENGRLPSSLQKVVLPLIEYRRCLSIMETVDRRLAFETVVCAGFPEGGKDACQGDSGGPFLCQRSQGRWVLVGVTSWGLGCARKWADNILDPVERRGSPGVFTDIQRLLNWLSENLNQDKPDFPTYQVQCSTNDGIEKGTTGEILLPTGYRKYYSNNEKCIWTIIVPRGKHILLTFKSFNVEWDYSCDLDYLVIYSALGRLIGKFCGDVSPRPLLIADASITLKFISDFHEYKTGFSLFYQAVEPDTYADSDCGSVAVIFEEGEIQTMNHPHLYSSNANCQWVVHSPANYIIKITFLVFEVEPSEGCIFDRLVVYHDLQGTVVAGFFCGFALPDPVLSVSNVMQITFTSDYSSNYLGFRAVISFVLPSSPVKPEKGNNQPRKNQDAMQHFDEGCGVSPLPPRFLYHNLIKAEEAMPNSWPWHVSINFGNKHVCNGAILSKTYVVTSANCVADREEFPSVGLIVAGLHDLESSINAQKRLVEYVIVHPDYNRLSKDYDVALIHVQRPFQYNAYVQPICLPDGHSRLEPSKLCVVSGWDLNVELSTKLQQLEVPVLMDDVCKKYYDGITDRMFCAGVIAEEDNASCLAQSGAPLVCESAPGTYVIFGIVSRGVGCNETPKAGVYSSVFLFIPWIMETILSVAGVIDTDSEPHHPLFPLDKLSQQKALLPDSPPSNDSSSSQDIYVTCKDVLSLQSPGEIKLVASGQDGPEGGRCQLIFQAPEGHFILLTFKQLSHEHYSLIIYEGASSNKTFKAQLMEEKIPTIMKSAGPVITLEASSTAQDSALHLWLSYSFHNQN